VAKVDRRILKSQVAIKKAVIDLMAEKKFDDITIQDISDKANVNRGTIYLHYQDKYDLLDKLIEEHIQELREMSDWACELDFIPATLIYFEYFQNNYSFFMAMLASKGAPYFRNRFLDYLIESFSDEVDITTGKNAGLNKEIILQYSCTAYVGIVEWWLKNGMPHSPQVMAEQVGTLLARDMG
jgi:Transcriptional regulator